MGGSSGLSLLNKNGRLGFICPHKFFNAKYGEAIRHLLSKGRHLDHVVHFGDQQIFKGASTYTCLLFLHKGGRDNCTISKIADVNEWRVSPSTGAASLSSMNLNEAPWNFAIGPGNDLLSRLGQAETKLSDVTERIAQGIRTSANEVYVLDLVGASEKTVVGRCKLSGQEVILERAITSLFLQGRDIKPYRICNCSKIVVIPYRVEEGRCHLLSAQDLELEYPRTYAYLLQHKSFLENREKGRMSGPSWYAYIYPKNIEVMTSPKILVPDIADAASFAFDDAGEYTFTSGYGITLKKPSNLSYQYILGLLNSRLLYFYLKHISTPMRGGFFRYFTQYLQQLPIRQIDFAKQQDKAYHHKIVSLVQRMLELNKRLQATNADHDRTILQRQITATDQQIDHLVYELYGLTKEEIAMVEAAV